MFVAVEGIDGSGKTSLCKVLREELPKRAKFRGVDFYQKSSIKVTREMGGSEVGSKIRDLVLNNDMAVPTELMLVLADRMEHLDKVILPHLKAGYLVITDRYIHSTFAYQCGGKGVSQKAVGDILSITGVLMPNLVIYLDVPLSASRERMGGRLLDRFEDTHDSFLLNVKHMYDRVLFNLADDELWGATCVRSVDASLPQDKVIETVCDAILDFYQHSPLPSRRVWRCMGKFYADGRDLNTSGSLVG